VILTHQRNNDYRTELGICLDTVQKRPQNPRAHNNLGTILCWAGKLEDADSCYRTALMLAPDYAAAHNNLGEALRVRNKTTEAVMHCREAVRLNPRSPSAHVNLGLSLGQQGHVQEEIEQYRTALQLKPDFVSARNNLAVTYYQQGKLAEAMEEFRLLLELQPGDVPVLNLVARVQATSPDGSLRNGLEAIDLAQRAVRLSGSRDPDMLDTLAAAYAEVGRFSEAVAAANDALNLAAAKGDAALADSLRDRIELYRAGKPLREIRRTSGDKRGRP